MQSPTVYFLTAFNFEAKVPCQNWAFVWLVLLDQGSASCVAGAWQSTWCGRQGEANESASMGPEVEQDHKPDDARGSCADLIARLLVLDRMWKQPALSIPS